MSSSPESNMALVKNIITTVGSIAATAMVFRSVADEILPSEFQDYISFSLKSIFNKFSNQITMVIDEFHGLDANHVYEAAQIYLGSKISPNAHRFKVSKPVKEKSFNVSMERNEEVIDFYNGQKYSWVWVCKIVTGSSRRNPRDMNSALRSEVRSFELTFDKKSKDFVLDVYLPYIINEAKLQEHEKKTLKIHTVDDYEGIYDLKEAWLPMNLDHPATFETLAMDLELKNKIVKDLDRFVKRKEYYRKVGKAWKRGYLLYGPPGTGKSSLIAAMANYLNFDIYDLELNEIKSNSDLRKLLLATANNSILVVEDIDCTIDLHAKLGNREADSPKKDSHSITP